MSKEFFSHPDKLYINHITNMFYKTDENLERAVKLFHDIAKLKYNFQKYIKEPSKKVANKNHSLLSAYIFLLNNKFDTKNLLFGFFAISSHHQDLENFLNLNEDNRYIGKYSLKSKELDFLDEVIKNANSIKIYNKLQGNIDKLEEDLKNYRRYIRSYKFKNSFDYSDFIEFKRLYSSLIFADKYEAIFSLKPNFKNNLDSQILTNYINSLKFNEKRDKFRNYVLSNFDKSHKLFTLTAPTGYGKTLTALEFALKFNREKIIFALPYTSIIDQTYNIIKNIFSKNNIFKIHHKSSIDESIDEDRYSKIKFLMNSFSGDINITTLYQIIFTLFGNKNSDNVKFNQFKNSVVIIDEAQAIPYIFRQDFIKICQLISKRMNTIFIFMSATMPIMSNNFKELSNLDYFKEQNRYTLKWLKLSNKQNSLISKIKREAKIKHTLCVVNTIKKAQELYLKFKDEFETYCINSYMSDYDKQRVIKIVTKKLKDNKSKILLISTQSIEAGVDLDFEVGFREVSPISSIIQTAGRVNRNFKNERGVLYIFEDISNYSNLIYGDLQQISQTIFGILQNKNIDESEILTLINPYFEKINTQLENLYLQKEIERLEFFNINQKIENIMENAQYKQLLIIEPYDGFIKEIENELLKIKNNIKDKFLQKDLTTALVKKMLLYSVNVDKKDILSFKTPVEELKYLKNIIYLANNSIDYDPNYGIKKYKLDFEDDIGFSFD